MFKKSSNKQTLLLNDMSNDFNQLKLWIEDSIDDNKYRMTNVSNKTLEIQNVLQTEFEVINEKFNAINNLENHITKLESQLKDFNVKVEKSSENCYQVNSITTVSESSKNIEDRFGTETNNFATKTLNNNIKIFLEN